MKKTIGIIGASSVAQALSKGFDAEGYEVMISSRTPDKTTVEGNIKKGTFKEAALFGEILVLYVMDASQEDMPLDSAVVKVTNGNEIKTVTTDQTGTAIFEDIKISDEIPFSIKKTGYTSISSTLDGDPNDYRQHQISQQVELYPLSGDSILATISGRLTFESNVTNREREAVPEGTVVKAFNYNLWNDIAFTGVTDADGNYEIKVPVSYMGNDDIDLVFSEIYTNQSLAVQQDDGSIAIEDRMTLFRLSESAQNDAIPSVPSAYAMVDAPTSETVGTGFSIASEVIPSALTGAGSAVIIRSGSGYDDGNDQLIDLSSGVNGNVAQLQVDISNGNIVNIDGFVNNGAVYSSTPTINTNVLNGSGAEIEIFFSPLWNVYIENNGSGYINFPQAVATVYQYGPNGNILKQVEPFNLADYTEIVNGKIINDDPADGDTITSGPSPMAVEIEIINTPTEQAVVSFDASNISTSGKITGMNIDEPGYGYELSNPPAISIISVAGFGSDAVIDLDLNAQGELFSFDIINQGTGYVKNVNDFRDDETTSDSEEDPSFSTGSNYWNFIYINNVSPGNSFIRSAHYGTGTPNDDL